MTDAAAGTAGAADLWDKAYAVFVGVPGGASGTVGQLESQGGGKANPRTPRQFDTRDSI